jgi:hypothetical protein
MSVSDREQKRAWLLLLGALAPLAVGVMVYFDYCRRESDAVMREEMLRREEARPTRDGSTPIVRKPISQASAPRLENGGVDGGVER